MSTHTDFPNAALAGDTEPSDLSRLHAALVERARSSGDLDLTFDIVDSPIGALLLAASNAGTLRVAFASEGHDAVLDRLSEAVGSRILKDTKAADAAHRQLDEYFEGRRRAFDLPIDLRLAQGFRREVLDHLRDIPFGSTASYGTVAAAAGRPKASRAVGTACATNPLPILVPCHRVVRADGTIGQYLGGVETKQRLLALESA